MKKIISTLGLIFGVFIWSNAQSIIVTPQDEASLLLKGQNPFFKFINLNTAEWTMSLASNGTMRFGSNISTNPAYTARTNGYITFNTPENYSDLDSYNFYHFGPGANGCNPNFMAGYGQKDQSYGYYSAWSADPGNAQNCGSFGIIGATHPSASETWCGFPKANMVHAGGLCDVFAMIQEKPGKPIIFGTDDSLRMIISGGSGWVGIGVGKVPLSPLHVGGDIRSDANLFGTNLILTVPTANITPDIISIPNQNGFSTVNLLTNLTYLALQNASKTALIASQAAIIADLVARVTALENK